MTTIAKAPLGGGGDRFVKYVALAVVSCLPSTLFAQATGDLRTVTEIVAIADAGVMNPVRQTIPAQTAIPVLQVLSASQTGNGQATARVSLDPASPTSFGLDVFSSATMGAMFGASASISGAVQWTLRGAASGQLSIELEATSNVFGGGPVSVRVVGTGVDMQVAVPAGRSDRRSQTVPISVAGAFALDCTFNGSAGSTFPSRTAQVSATARLRFVPDVTPAVIVSYGPTCGAQLSASDRAADGRHSIALVAIGGFPSAPIAMAFGSRRDNAPINGSPCLLLLQPVAAVLLVADAAGGATLGFELPGPLRSPPIQLQAVPFTNGQPLRTSNGVEVTFVD
jgi:hypothetical protein